MKYLIIIFVSLGISVQAQSTVEAFISKASEIKLQQRAITRQEVADFEQTVLELQEELNVKLDFLYAEAELGSEKQEALAVNSNQENLVSKEDQQKYMQLALQKMENEKKQNQKNNTNTISNNTTRMELMNKQKALSDKIRADQLRIDKLYIDFENDTIERNKMYENIQNWQTKWYELSGIDYGQGPKMEALAQKIREEQIKICDNNTPLYQDILTKHLSMIKSSYPDYIELHKVTNQLSNAAIGIQSSEVDNSIFGLKLVNEYLSKLSTAYYYKLYFPEDDH